MSRATETPIPTADATADATLVPYVSTTLRVVWFPAGVAGDAVWVRHADADPADLAAPDLHYRLTPEVFAWCLRRIWSVDDRYFAARARAAADADAVVPDVEALAGPLAEAGRRWRIIAAWAETAWTAEELAGARAGLPREPEMLPRAVREGG